MKKIILTTEQIQEAQDMYKKGFSLQKVGEHFNISRTAITRIFKECDISIQKSNHKYRADYRKFQNIDSNEKAYWLGFIAADGCVYQREKNASIIINIHRKDREHLEKFKNFMNSNVNIVDHVQTEGFSNNTPMSKIVFNSKEMAEDLIRIGITPRKSLTLTIPNIDEKYHLAFILGYFDGDGSISLLKNKEYSISIVGTKEILEWINEKLHICSKLEKKDEKNDANTYYIRCGGTNKPYKIMKQLYDNSTFYLERKYNIFKTLETVVLNRNIK